MLQELYIKNIAIIKELEISFGSGLNILTGETGAGKTIILNSLGLLLGARSDFDVIRSGEDKARVQGVFSGDVMEEFIPRLDDLDLPAVEEELIITRDIDRRGRSKAKVNGERILLNQLQTLTRNTIDIHSQHQHQSLLDPEFQRELLDSFAGLSGKKNDFRNRLLEYRSITEKISQLETEKDKTREQRDFFEFEIDKIDSINPEPGEDIKLREELNLVKNSELLFEKLKLSLDKLYDEDNSIVNNLNSIIFENSRTSEIDSKIEKQVSRLKSVLAEVEDISYFIRDYLNGLDFSPEHTEELNLRLSQLEDLKRRFKRDLSGVLDYREEIRTKLDNLKNFDINIDGYLKRRTELEKELGELALGISKTRKKFAKLLEKQVESGLRDLNMSDARFQVRVIPRVIDSGGIEIKGKNYDVIESGIDDILFMISPNKGEELRDLDKIISGGELSRVMLSIKEVFSDKNQVKILIFDEIDAGIGGKTADVVGRKLKKLSESVQVVVITHLPQIARFADHHFKIEKVAEGDRTVTVIKQLEPEEQKQELARMLSGENITDLTLQHAEELLSENKKGNK